MIVFALSYFNIISYNSVCLSNPKLKVEDLNTKGDREKLEGVEREEPVFIIYYLIIIYFQYNETVKYDPRQWEKVMHTT